ncbi:MAG: murein biosynthesis integral membrane protein MurJ [Alphaproteobacteria bacterium]|nr:murein biosynthesis integral membrane protein MurJ [Alphaproteobacteria bacterium]
MSLIKSIATVSGGTFISRIVGFVRDIFMARFLGASMMADAFFVAWRLPNLFRSLFAEGALNVAFVPLLASEIQNGGKKDAIKFTKAVFNFLLYVLLAFTLVVEIIMPAVMFLLAPGFDEIPGKLALTTSLSRITFPFLLCVSLVSLLSGVLNSLGKFWAAAFAPTLLNISMIAFLLFLTPYINSNFAPAYALAWGVMAAGIIELLFVLYHVYKADYLFGLMNPIKALYHLAPGVKTLLRKMAPGVLGSGVYQINLFFDTLFVSFVGAGAISWLNYAQHMFQLPIGVIGVAIGTALLPVLSRHIKAGEYAKANTQLNRGLEVSIAMSVASAVGLILLATPIIQTLFQHGLFTAQDTANTAKALMIFACGLPAYMLTKALAPFFYARGDTATPVKIAIIGVTLNAILALILMQFWGYLGIAMATGITTWVNAIQYWILLKKHKQFYFDTLFKYRFPRILLSCCIMGVFLWLIKEVDSLIPAEIIPCKVREVVLLSVMVGGGVIAFIIALLITRGIPMSQFLALLRRRGGMQ